MKFAANQAVANPTPAGISKTVNQAGGTAFTQDLRVELASLVLTSMLKDKFYSKGMEDAGRAAILVQQLIATYPGGARFAAKAALYARRVHGLRSISHVVAGSLAMMTRGETWRRPFFQQIVSRPDDAIEIVSYVRSYNTDKRLPNSLTRGIAKALEGMSEYQLAKYQGKASMTMIDVVNLCHPKSTPALTALMHGTLKPADTWETALSKAGNAGAEETDAAVKEEKVAAAKADQWERLLTEKKLGYLATLRNLRNIIEQSPKCLDLACAVLTNAEQVKKARIFPFQFMSALDAIESLPGPKAKTAREALVVAMDHAVANVPKFTGATAVVVDKSGSMNGGPIKIASLFAATLMKASEDADLILFADEARNVNPIRSTPTLALAGGIVSNQFGGGTNFHCIFPALARKYDRVIILSDMQGWMGGNTPEASVTAYRKKFSADPFVYSFDLNGSGSTQFAADKCLALAGWSDKVFDVMAMLEADRNALVNEIEKVVL